MRLALSSSLLLLLVACGGEAAPEAPAAEPATEAAAEPEVDEQLKEVVEKKAEEAMAGNIAALLENPVEVSDVQKASCEKLTECSCSDKHVEACHQGAAKMDAALVEKGKDAHGTWTTVGELSCEVACDGFLKAMESEFRDLAL